MYIHCILSGEVGKNHVLSHQKPYKFYNTFVVVIDKCSTKIMRFVFESFVIRC